MVGVFQKCKRDVWDPSYPCERPRCGHRWTVRYRESGARRGRQREKSFSRRVGLDVADAFVVHGENDKKSGTCLDSARGAVCLLVWAQDWVERRAIGDTTRRNYDGGTSP